MASAVLAALVLGRGVSAPVRGRLADRRSPGSLVVVLGISNALTIVLLVAVGHLGAPVVLAVATAALVGATTPPVPAITRAVIADAVRDEALRTRAFALLNVIMEMGFLIGPLIAGTAIALGQTGVGILAVAVLSVGASLAVARCHLVRGAQGRRRGAFLESRTVLRRLAPLLMTIAFFGMAFGAIDVAVPAFARQVGHPSTAGWLLATPAIGLGVGSYLYGVWSPVDRGAGRYRRFCALAAVSLLPLPFMPSAATMAAAGLVLGLGFAPASISQFQLADDLLPQHRAEAVSWMTSLFAGGSAAGAAAAGQAIDAFGARSGLSIAMITGFLGAVIAGLTGWEKGSENQLPAHREPSSLSKHA